jgi:hypothetical protein
MSTAIAILSYRRGHALRAFMVSLREHCTDHQLAVFEDCGNADDTCAWLKQSAKFVKEDTELAAERWEGFDYVAFLGTRNLGVSGNSNRALHWFMHETDCDHLCLCNDDLIAKGDFTKIYAEAHKATGIGLFCFSDWTDDDNKPVPVRDRGRVIHMLTRRKGIMMSMTRKMVDRIGYFDAEAFGKFGDEHNDYTNRAAQAGFLNLKGQAQHCLDVPCKLLSSVDVPSSINPIDKSKFDAEAALQLNVAAGRYPSSDPRRAFSLGGYSRFAGAYSGAGIAVWSLRRMGYAVVDGFAPDTV